MCSASTATTSRRSRIANVDAPRRPVTRGAEVADARHIRRGEARWAAIWKHELEGVVAKAKRSRYVSGERGWLKVKNRDHWRYELEREGALNIRRSCQFV
jgi:ATP-dependent DNA ligase